MRFSKKRIKKWGNKSEKVVVSKIRQKYTMDKIDYQLVEAMIGKRPDDLVKGQEWDERFENAQRSEDFN